LDADSVLYTAPGLHENSRELEKQLKRRIGEAKRISSRVIVVYGSRCYVDIEDPSRDIDRVIKEEGDSITRIKAKNCVDMLAALSERERISSGQKVYWLSPGWLKYWKAIFKDWDQGKANETFPQYDKAILLDPIGIFGDYSALSPEKILEFADWMKIGIEPYEISLDRLERLLSDEVV